MDLLAIGESAASERGPYHSCGLLSSPFEVARVGVPHFLFMSPTCPYSDRSMDFYARLGRTVDSLLQLSSLSAVGVLEVPIVAILDPSGRTRSAWRGLQNSTSEREILAAVRAMGATP